MLRSRRSSRAELDKCERDLVEIPYLVLLDGEVRKDREIVRPEAPNPVVVAVGTALQFQIERGELDVWVREFEPSVKVSPVEGLDGSVVQNHVLLRHRPASISPRKGVAPFVSRMSVGGIEGAFLARSGWKCLRRAI